MLKVTVDDHEFNTGTLIIGFDPDDANGWVMLGMSLRDFCIEKASECGMDPEEAFDHIRDM